MIRYLSDMRIAIFILILFQGQFLAAQSCLEKINQERVDRVVQFIDQGKAQSAQSVLDSFFQASNDKAFRKCEIYFKALYEQGQVYFIDAELSKAQKLYNEVIHDPLVLQYPRELAKAHIGMSLAYEWSQNGELCMDHLNRAWKIIEEHNLHDIKALYYMRLSSCGRGHADRSEALEHAKLALKYAEEYNDGRNLVDAYFLISKLSTDPDEQIYYAQKELEYKKSVGHYLNIAMHYSSEISRPSNPKMLGQKSSLDSAWHYMSKVKEKTKEYYLYGSIIAKDSRNYYERIGNIIES